MEVLESLFSKALKLESPWEITKVEFLEKEGRINIFIDFPKGSVFQCPKCKKQAKAYDTTKKKWRHMNFFQYACYLVVRVPRTEVSIFKEQRQLNGIAEGEFKGNRVYVKVKLKDGKGISYS